MSRRRGAGSGPGADVARAAALIAGITIAARVVGLIRTAVFARTVGSGCIGSVYQTVNAIPNIVFDVVAGGMLSAAVIPLLAGPLTGGDRERAGRIASALLCWCLVALGVITILLVVLAGPLSSLLLGNLGGGASCPGAHQLGRQMLMLFAPQVLLYGIGVVLTGVLQAARRFAWPALAPLLSSLAVIVAYLWFGATADSGQRPDALGGWLIVLLAGGTTVGVAVLALCQVPAAARLRLPVRPSLRFPDGASGVARAALAAGAATLAGQQLSTAVLLRLANESSSAGSVVVTTLAQTVFFLPWAVLAVPLATSAFPRLAAASAAGDADQFRASLDGVLRILAVVTAVGAAALFAAAEPVATVLLDRSAPGHAGLAPAIAVFAIGLPGWSLVALLGRALYAAGRYRASAAGQVLGWVAAIAGEVALALAVPDRYRAAALAGGYVLGVSVGGALLLVACRSAGLLSGGAPLARALLAMVAAAGAGGGVGMLIGRLARHAGVLAGAGLGVLAACAAAAVALAVLGALGGLGGLDALSGRGPRIGSLLRAGRRS